MTKLILVASFLAACTEHGKGGGVPPTPDDPPAACEGHCILDEPTEPSSDLCCDSVTCFIDVNTGEWQVVFCDPQPGP
jgi:hypothetical protein